MKKSIFSLITVIAFAFILSGISTTYAMTTEDEQYISKVAEKIKQTWPYMNKVWPNLDYTQYNVVVFYLDSNNETQKVWLINSQACKTLKKPEYESIIPPMPNGFDIIEYLGKPSISLSLTEDYIKENLNNDQFFRLITHELVHFYNQSKIALPVSNGNSRVQEYPIQVEPRLYRGMLYMNLKNAVLEKNNKRSYEYMRKAAYWLNKWKPSYLDEASRVCFSDIVEGHAKYIEHIAMAITPSGSIGDVTLNIQPEKLSHFAAYESYQLGIMSGILLDRYYPNWKQAFLNKKLTPAELLLEQVPPLTDEANAVFEKDLSAYIKGKNHIIEGYFQHISPAMKNKTIPYLKINVKHQEGSMSSEGAYKYKGEEVISQYTSSIKTNLKTLTVDTFSVFTEAENDSLYIIIPMTEDYSQIGDCITFSGPHVYGQIEITDHVMIDGREWFIVD